MEDRSRHSPPPPQTDRRPTIGPFVGSDVRMLESQTHISLHSSRVETLRVPSASGREARDKRLIAGVTKGLTSLHTDISDGNPAEKKRLVKLVLAGHLVQKRG